MVEMTASVPSSRGGPEASLDSTPPTTQLPMKWESTTTTTTTMIMSMPPAISTAQPPKRRRRRITRPAKDSLLDLIHQHPGMSLFVRPICWTDVHAQLLGVQFQELPPCDTPLPVNIPGSPPSRGHMRPSQTITILSTSLTDILMPAVTNSVQGSHAVRTVLSTLWPVAFSQPQIMPELHLFFGDRVYRDTVRTQVMWSYPSDPTQCSQNSFKSMSTRPADSHGIFSSSPAPYNQANLPMVCYIGKAQLASIRRNLFRIAPGPNKTWNEPVIRLQRLRAKMLTPSNADHDAHFVGIFLAMAQRHFYGIPAPSSRRDSQWASAKGKPPRPVFQDIKLRILTHDNDTADFVVHTGYVTAKFLERFHDPLKIPDGEEGTSVPGMKIEYTRVPIWPILGLRERLGKALGEDVVGQFEPSDMETWEEDVPSEPGSGKRKREALSEVFNGSFTEGSDDEPAEVTGKKRCLSEGGLVGVLV